MLDISRCEQLARYVSFRSSWRIWQEEAYTTADNATTRSTADKMDTGSQVNVHQRSALYECDSGSRGPQTRAKVATALRPAGSTPASSGDGSGGVRQGGEGHKASGYQRYLNRIRTNISHIRWPLVRHPPQKAAAAIAAA